MSSGTCPWTLTAQGCCSRWCQHATRSEARCSPPTSSSANGGTILGDDKLASAMIDRVVHHGRLVEFNGTSKRMDKALMLGKAEI